MLTSLSALTRSRRGNRQLAKAPGLAALPAIAMTLVLTALIFPMATGSQAFAQDQVIHKSHAFTLFEEPKYPVDFQHFDWVNPDAPKGGTLRISRLGGFDNLNPWTDKGDTAAGMSGITETLMSGSSDEKGTYYGLIAHTMEWPEDRTWITFYMRPEAKFSDGTPITADDVIFSYEAMTSKAAPIYASSYEQVGSVEKIDDHTVTFRIKEGETNREFPLVAASLPILPAHWWEGRDFLETSLDVPLGSGPYLVTDFEANRYVEWQRDPNYWGKDLPINVGLNNFDVQRDEYYSDATVMRIAFKAGEFDYWVENRSKAWATEYEPGQLKPLDEGYMIKAPSPDNEPQTFQTMVFNYNRPQLQDWRVRRAVNRLFNFEWTNKTLFFDAYTRADSLFTNTSDLRADGLPSGRTLEILNQYKDQINPLIFTEEWALPKTDGSQNNAASLKLALEDFQAAGYEIARSGDKRGQLIHKETGERLAMEFVFYSDNFDSILGPLVQDLQRLGVDANLKRIDTQSWLSRVRDRNFDITSISYSNSFYPGEEQRRRWGSEFADVPLSWNLTAMKNPVVDGIIEDLLKAETYEELTAHARALDYILKWDYPGLFEWYIDIDRFLFWDRFGKPDTKPTYGLGLGSWWLDPERHARVQEAGYYK